MFNKLIEKIKAEPKTMVFTEGTDARILSAASRLLAEGLMGVILVGNVDDVKAAADIVIPSCDEDGVAWLIDRYLL